MSALAGIRVLDFGRYVAGPYCAAMLGDMGADVIRVEWPGRADDRFVAPIADDGSGALFLQVNRNKRSLTLNLKRPGAHSVLRDLISVTDVVIANVPTGALKSMGLDYATLSAIRPDIILANASSFGAHGPWSERPGFDSVGQAMCGSAYLSGPGDAPYRTPITWVDHSTAMYLAFGVMAALMERAKSGRGQVVEASLLGSALAISSTYLIEQAAKQLDRTAIGNRSFLNGPTDTFRTRDGWIVTQIVGNALFQRWAHLMHEPQWTSDPRFASDDLRGQNGAALSERMRIWCAERTNEQALDELAGANIPAGPVLSPRQALDHPQVQAMQLFTPPPAGAGNAPLCRLPVELSLTPASIREAAPAIGQHTDEILLQLGLAQDKIDALRQDGAI